jgi:acetate CoA/acetoacetate CoA-transferase beta subunit
MAHRIAKEPSPGMLVNLGIGIPTLVANHLPPGHAYLLSVREWIDRGWRPPEEGMAHPTLSDVAGSPVIALPGASTFDSTMSFGVIRGGHHDLTVLGGLQNQSGNGVTSNKLDWRTNERLAVGKGATHRDRERRKA